MTSSISEVTRLLAESFSVTVVRVSPNSRVSKAAPFGAGVEGVEVVELVPPSLLVVVGVVVELTGWFSAIHVWSSGWSLSMEKVRIWLPFLIVTNSPSFERWEPWNVLFPSRLRHSRAVAMAVLKARMIGRSWRRIKLSDKIYVTRYTYERTALLVFFLRRKKTAFRRGRFLEINFKRSLAPSSVVNVSD